MLLLLYRKMLRIFWTQKITEVLRRIGRGKKDAIGDSLEAQNKLPETCHGRYGLLKLVLVGEIYGKRSLQVVGDVTHEWEICVVDFNVPV